MRVQQRNMEIKKLKSIQEKIKSGNYTNEDLLALTDIMMNLLQAVKVN